MPVISKALLMLAAVVVGWFAVDDYMSTRAELKTLRDENASLATQLAASNKQHNAEGAIGQQGLSYDRQGTAQQEKTQSEIRQQVDREPCAKVAIPDASAKRLWQLAESTRAATLPDAARQPDRVAPAATAGK
ncbi:hypothetical protein JD793_004696 [Citrobacter braakii]|nr:hypothetical protein [Citrobacter braakii]